MRIMLLVLLVLLVTIHPKLNKAWDLTSNRINSLTPETEVILDRLEQDFTFHLSTPKLSLIEDFERALAPFQKSSSFVKLRTDFLPPSPKLIDEFQLETTDTLTIGYGERRIALDIKSLPFLNESAIAALLHKLIITHNRWVVFLSGHGERQAFGHKMRDFEHFTTVLKHQGNLVASLSLEENSVIPDNTHILIITEPSTAFQEREKSLIEKYLKQGGHVLWLREPNATGHLNFLETLLGLHLSPLLIQDPNGQRLGSPNPAIVIIQNYPEHFLMEGFAKTTAFPWSTPLEKTQAFIKDFELLPLLMTDPQTWVQNNEQPLQGPFMLAATLKRKINPKTEQRIVVFANSTFLSNGSIHNYGNLALGLRSLNWLNEGLLVPVRAEQLTADLNFPFPNWYLQSLFYGFCLLLPGLLLLLGLYLPRKKKIVSL